jgi:hypothetical protein
MAGVIDYTYKKMVFMSVFYGLSSGGLFASEGEIHATQTLKSHICILCGITV